MCSSVMEIVLTFVVMDLTEILNLYAFKFITISLQVGVFWSLFKTSRPPWAVKFFVVFFY